MRSILSIGVLAGALLWALPSGAQETDLAKLVDALGSADQAARLEAIDHLGRMGDQAAEAVPALAGLLEDESPSVRAHAAEALGHIGAPARRAVRKLIKLLTDDDPVVRREAVEAIADIRPGPRVTIPLMAEVLKDDDPAVVIRALNVVADLGERAVPFLTEALQDEETAYWACLVVSEIGPDAKATVPALIGLVEKGGHLEKREAILALAAIGEAAAPAAGVLAKTLEDEIHRVPATYALGSIGRVPDEVETKIKNQVKSSDEVLSTVSLWALARLHPDDQNLIRRATGQLIEAIQSDDPHVRSAAARALIDLDPDPEISRPLVEKALENADEEVVAAMLGAMADLGARAVPRLIKGLEFEKTRPYAVYILGEIGPEAEPAVPALVELIDDENPEVQREVMFALAKIGPGAKAAVPKLIETLQECEGPVCFGACYALGSIGADAVDAKPVLRKALNGEDDSLCLFSAWALAHIDPGCTETCGESVPVLAKGLEDESAQFRVQAASALQCLGPLAKPAAGALKKALQDEDEQVRQAAAEALKAIGE